MTKHAVRALRGAGRGEMTAPGQPLVNGSKRGRIRKQLKEREFTMANPALNRTEPYGPFGTRNLSRRIRALLSQKPAMASFLGYCHRRTYPAKSVIISAGH